jgi:hypothetical protein
VLNHLLLVAVSYTAAPTIGTIHNDSLPQSEFENPSVNTTGSPAVPVYTLNHFLPLTASTPFATLAVAIIDPASTRR